MSKQIEALKLALEALKQIDEAMPFPVAKFAQAAIREALAEQPAQQQEPHEWLTGCPDCGMDSCDCDEGTWNPPASKQWIGLTEQERNDLEDYCEMIIGKPAFEAIEAKLREKNAQPTKPLTNAQIGAVAADIWGSILIAPQSYQAFARAVEAAHGITGEK